MAFPLRLLMRTAASSHGHLRQDDLTQRASLELKWPMNMLDLNELVLRCLAICRHGLVLYTRPPKAKRPAVRSTG